MITQIPIKKELNRDYTDCLHYCSACHFTRKNDPTMQCNQMLTSLKEKSVLQMCKTLFFSKVFRLSLIGNDAGIVMRPSVTVLKSRSTSPKPETGFVTNNRNRILFGCGFAAPGNLCKSGASYIELRLNSIDIESHGCMRSHTVV